MDVVELGGIRLHLLHAYPGLPGEADQVLRGLAKLAPAIILADLDTEDALRLRAAMAEKRRWEPGFVDALFENETRRRYADDTKPEEHPVAAAARYARDRHVELLPLRALAPKPGFFARRRAQKAVASLEAADPAAFPATFQEALREARVWNADDAAESMRQRMQRALREGRAPVVAIVQAHRRAAFDEVVRSTRRLPA